MRYHAQKNLSFPSVELFPYQAPDHSRSRDDYRHLAANLQQFEQGRRGDFLERLKQFRLTGDESLRSFPAKLFEPVCTYEMPPPPRVLLHSPRALEIHASHHVLDDAPMASISDYAAYGESGEVFPPYPDDLDPLRLDPAFEQIPLGDYSDVPMGAPSVNVLPAEVLADDTQIDWAGAKEGTVSQFGHYHYKFDKNQSMSYLVRLGRNEYVWGIDLERVVNLQSIKKGDQVQLKCIGKQPVEVEVRVKQPDETFKIEKQIVKRNTWVARVLARGAEQQPA
jgi:hypothetical protein